MDGVSGRVCAAGLSNGTPFLDEATWAPIEAGQGPPVHLAITSGIFFLFRHGMVRKLRGHTRTPPAQKAAAQPMGGKLTLTDDGRAVLMLPPKHPGTKAERADRQQTKDRGFRHRLQADGFAGTRKLPGIDHGMSRADFVRHLCRGVHVDKLKCLRTAGRNRCAVNKLNGGADRRAGPTVSASDAARS